MTESEFTTPREANEKTENQIPQKVEWQVPSELTGMNTYRNKFERLLSTLENSWIEPDDISDLTVGFDEALINAIKYGNKEDVTKLVEIGVTIEEEKLQVSIQDQNPESFDPNTAFDSVHDEAEILATHGRGITMMKHYYDTVEFEFMNPGNKVTLTKNRNPQ